LEVANGFGDRASGREGSGGAAQGFSLGQAPEQTTGEVEDEAEVGCGPSDQDTAGEGWPGDARDDARADDDMRLAAGDAGLANPGEQTPEVGCQLV
jgi:hypothetical protein